MNMRLLALTFVLTLSSVACARADAQLPENFLYQVSLGVNNSSGSQFPDKEFESVELLFGKQFKTFTNIAPLVVVNGGSTGHLLPGGENLTCRITPGYASCGAEMPSIAYFGLLGGAHVHHSIFSIGAMLGPQLIFTSSQTSRTGATPTVTQYPPINRFALQSRIDLAVVALPHTEIVFSARQLFVPNFYEGQATLRGASLGVRFY